MNASSKLSSSFLSGALVPLLVGSAPPARGDLCAYVANDGSDCISVIDVATNTLATEIGVHGSPRAVAVDPAGRFIYTVVDGKLLVIDSGTYTPLRRIPPAEGCLDSLMIAPRGTLASLADSCENDLDIDALTVVLGPDGRTAYLGDINNGVDVVDLERGVVTGSIYTGSWGSYDTPLRSAMSSDGTRLYVPAPDVSHVGTLAVVDTATATIADTITFLPELEDPEPIAVALSPDNRRAYVLLQAANGLLPVLDTANRAVADVLEIGGAADSIAVSSDGSKLYLARATAAGEELNVIDVQTKGVSQIPLGMASGGILAVVPRTGVVYVAASALAFAVDTQRLAVMAQIPVGGNSRDIAVGRINGPCRPAAYTPEPTSTPTPTATVTPTKAPTVQCPTGMPCLQISSASIPAGGDGTITVHLATAGQRITGIQNDVFFDSAIALHDCSSDLPLVGGFHDFGSSLRAVLYSPAGQTLSDGALLYSCTVTVASGTPLGKYPLLTVNIIAADALGNRITVAGADGEVTVTGPDAGAPSNTDPGTASSTSGGCQITGGSAADSLWLGLVIPILLLRRRGRAAEFRRLA